MAQKKVIIAGLENCGKTSIILSMEGKKNLLNFLKLNPTKGLNTVNFQANETNFNIWDLGGQKMYRDDYLEHFKRFFSEVDKLIYVIDIQEVNKYETALDYLNNIVKELYKQHVIIPITIFLHKNDPDLNEIRPDIKEEIIESLINKTKKLVPSEYFLEIFKTTIFTVFNKEHVL